MGEFGVYTRAELLSSGLTRNMIEYRTKKGALHRVLPSVYSVDEPTYLTRCRAVIVWKSAAVLSHRTAAWLWGLLPDEPPVVEATVPKSAQVRSPNRLVLHRRPDVGPADHLYGLPVVSAEQTCIDVATLLPGADLERSLDGALSGKVTSRALRRRSEEAAGMHGVTEIRRQLRTACPFTASEPERMVARGLTARGFFMEINAPVGPYFGDLVDYRARVIVEIDGREFHSDPHAFTNDRRRQNELVLGGWLVLRYSAATVNGRLDQVVDEIMRVVRRRRKSVAASQSRTKFR